MSKKIIITAQGCGACERLKEGLKNKGKLGEFEIIDVAGKDGEQKLRDLISKNPSLDVSYVPDCAEIDSNGNVKKCDIKAIWNMIED